MTVDRPQPYRIIFSPQVGDQLRDVLRTAAVRGDGPAARTASLIVAQALTWIPESIGEPAYDLPTLGRVYIGGRDPILVRYTVSERLRVVYISWFRLLPQLAG